MERDVKGGGCRRARKNYCTDTAVLQWGPRPWPWQEGKEGGRRGKGRGLGTGSWGIKFSYA